jgi:RND family efflux transporter MFP subunit
MLTALKHFHRVALTTGVFAALAIAGCRKAPETTSPPPVKTVTATLRDAADEISVSGVIEAVDKAQLAFMVPGRILSVEVEDGQSVEKGQLLARLDDTDYKNEVAIADARLGEIRGRHERLTKLHALGSVTATDYEKIVAAFSEAESGASLAHRRLEYTELHAPFAGRIVRHAAAAGTVVGPGVPIVTVLAPAPVWATLSVPEVDASRIQMGKTASVTLAATENVEVSSPVETILPQADAITRTFAVKVRLPNENGAFRAGNVITARIATGAKRQGIFLSPQLVQRFADGALYVWLADAAHNTVTRRIVTVGKTAASEVEITSGLQSGERVVVAGGTPLFDGMRVSLSSP